MGFWTYVSLALGIAVALAVVVAITQRPSGKRMLENALAQIDGFNASESFIGLDFYSSIAMDEGNGALCLLRIAGTGVEYRVLGYRDVLCSEVSEDGITVARTSRSSQTGTAAAKNEPSSGTVKRIGLRIQIKDAKSPIHEITFCNTEMDRDSALYRQVSAKVLHWHGLIHLFIRQADEETTEPPSVKSPKPSPHFYVADELYKLVQLRDSGVLTPNEFEEQKTRLLS